MPNKKRAKVRSKDVQGLKYLRVLRPLLERLHTVGTERDVAGNRQLHMDQYCMLVLLWLYSPCLSSLRGIQQASLLKKVQKRFGIPRASLGTLSESVRIFDPEPLKAIAQELSAQIPRASQSQADLRLAGLGKTLTAVDGSVVKVLQRVAELAWIRMPNGHHTCGYRLHTQFEILRGIPNRIDATSANPSGPNDERAVLERSLETDRLYVLDRGYQKWQLWNAIHAIQSSYVCRVRDKMEYEVVEDRPLWEADEQAGVLSDQVIVPARDPNPVDHPIRMICVRCTQHASRGVRSGRKLSSSGPGSDGILRIVTDMLDVPAELIAEIYRLRWTIEIFFRMFKQLLGCRHLLSTKPEGVEIQVYCALIACLLIQLYTGGKVTLRTFEMVCFYISGWADLEELEAHIAKLQPNTP